ncbi:hypothetical protein [Pelagicoccus sp. SDUM812005]|uniref:hypothetical protein n=1 Tax=Pelagicoccus sp. SDUM812005 TaxID=3041257 RepID=UPI00280EAA5E|nr:hypothetical protein [Pelagicoccus sp. SDUM812005]MDQ8182063.1 hypothetical protein [Pelagicoccus sp. SDUM812005]
MNFKKATLPAISLLLASSVWSSGLKSDLRLSGFVSTGYLESSHYNYPADTEGGTTAFSELGLNASWTPKDRLTVNGQIFAFELGPYGNYDPMVDYLFLDYNVKREFGVRFGRVKREQGIYTHVQDIDLSRTSILLPIGMYDQRFRDISAALDGASLYGNIDLWNDAYLDYVVYGGVVELEPDGGVGGVALTAMSQAADNLAVEYIEAADNRGAQLWLSPGIDGLRIGFGVTEMSEVEAAITGSISAYHPNPYFAGLPLRSEFSDFTLKIEQLSLEYFVGEWNLTSEYAESTTSYDAVSSIAGTVVSGGPGKSKARTWYASLARRLGRFEAAVTYSEENGGGLLSSGGPDSVTEDMQLSLRYDVTDFWTLKTEVHSLFGTSRLFNEFNQNPIRSERNWTLFAAKSTFFF